MPRFAVLHINSAILIGLLKLVYRLENETLELCFDDICECFSLDK